MKPFISIFTCMILGISIYGQTIVSEYLAVSSLPSASVHDSIYVSNTELKEPLKIWVYTKENTLQKGVLIAVSDTALNIYSGSIGEFKKKTSPQLISLSYDKVSVIKTKKEGGIF